MQRFHLIKVLLVFCLSLSLYSVAVAKTTTPQQRQFIQIVLKNARIVNRNIIVERKSIKDMYQMQEYGDSLSPAELNWLDQLADEYDIQQPNFEHHQVWKKLFNRVDIIPNSLIIAQAIYESNWGKSRFAQLGNNYFGQRCFRQGCGIVPAQRPDGHSFEVRRFPSLSASIESYVNNLNTHMNYSYLRQIRSQTRQSGFLPDGVMLADGLSSYSEQGHYIQSIKSIIKAYHLAQYDV